MYLGFCSEYCYLIKDVKVIGNYPVLERKCNWCHGTYEYRYGDNRKDSFCGLGWEGRGVGRGRGDHGGERNDTLSALV